MADLAIRALEPGDIEFIAEHLRQADRDEVRAARGPVDMRDVLSMAVLRSSHYWVAAAGEPVAVFGVAPLSLLDGSGCPWFLGTERTLSFPRALVREGRTYARRMLEAYPHLANFVDARNTQSIRWLRRIGFVLHPAEPYGAAGLPFHKFEMTDVHN